MDLLRMGSSELCDGCTLTIPIRCASHHSDTTDEEEYDPFTTSPTEEVKRGIYMDKLKDAFSKEPVVIHTDSDNSKHRRGEKKRRKKERKEKKKRRRPTALTGVSGTVQSMKLEEDGMPSVRPGGATEKEPIRESHRVPSTEKEPLASSEKEPRPAGFHPVCLCVDEGACEPECPTLRYAP
jgi:hypothetical protein